MTVEKRQAFSYKDRAEYWEDEATKAVRLSQDSTTKGNYVAALEYDRIAEQAQKHARSERKAWADEIIAGAIDRVENLSNLVNGEDGVMNGDVRLMERLRELRAYCLGKL